ncbi:hypothetical protein PTI98_003431 [Pleurotus ostreatus]|nr:hypothetical protein PTI98_003431 [Pleurotus ostreatus]
MRALRRALQTPGNMRKNFDCKAQNIANKQYHRIFALHGSWSSCHSRRYIKQTIHSPVIEPLTALQTSKHNGRTRLLQLWWSRPSSCKLPKGSYNCGGEGHVSRDCTSDPKPKTCYKCGSEGHLSRECPDASAGGGNTGFGGGSGGECYRCGKPGHIARACPESAGGGSGAFGGSYGGGGYQKTCYTCGGVGHLSRDCVQGSKCYNCSQTGHISRECPQPQKRACYSCGSEGHISRDCPNAGAADAAA